MKTVKKEVNDLRKESKADDIKLNEKLDEIDMESCKRFLVVEMTKIEDGAYKPNAEQRRVLYETKEIYNNRGRR